MMRSRTESDDSLLAIRERYLGPSLLSPFADDLAQRLSRLHVGPLLETMADIGALHPGDCGIRFRRADHYRH